MRSLTQVMIGMHKMGNRLVEVALQMVTIWLAKWTFCQKIKRDRKTVVDSLFF